MATHIVTTTYDIVNGGDGVLSLREAVQDAVNGDVIQLASDTYSLTANLEIDKDVTISSGGGTTISGSGFEDVVVLHGSKLTLDGPITYSAGRLAVNSGGQAEATDVSFVGGIASAGSVILHAGFVGGQISNLSTSQLTAFGTSISAPISNSGTATINGGSIQAGFSNSSGGTSTIDGVAFSSGVQSSGTLQITDSTFINPGNNALVIAGGTTTLSRVTISGADSAGIHVENNGSLQAEHSTVTGNGGPGILVDAGGAIPQFRDSIILGNNSGSGVEIENNGTANILPETILSGNLAEIFAAIDPATGGGQLADNGGPVQTVALRGHVSNPAVDSAGSASGDDARGRAPHDFAGVGNDGSTFRDVGSFELTTADLPGGVLAQTDTGTIAIAEANITPGASFTVTVSDADLNTDSGVAETVEIEVDNTTTGENETLTLTETGLDTGVFTAALATAFGTSAGVTDDGTLNVQAADAVVATYADAQTSTGGTASPTDSVNILGGTTGTIVITEDSIFPGASFTITVTDADFNTDAGVAETITAEVDNQRTSEGETLVLTETGVDTGVFTTTAPTAFGASSGPSSDGALNVQAGDVIATTYADSLTAVGGRASPIDNIDVLGGATGTIVITEDSILPGAGFTITVTDADLNRDTGVAESIDVEVDNTTTGENETLTLAETGLDTGVFTATLATAFGTTAGTNDDGLLNIQAADAVIATYADARTATGGAASPTDMVTITAPPVTPPRPPILQPPEPVGPTELRISDDVTGIIPVGLSISIAEPGNSLPRDETEATLRSILQNQGHETGLVADEFLSGLSSDIMLDLKILTLTGSASNRREVIRIEGSPPNPADENPEAFVVDASTLPAGTRLNLHNIEFAVILGPVVLSGGSGNNVVVGDDQIQTIILGPGDDRLYGLDGDDTIGSLGGNDMLFGGDGDDQLSGGSGENFLHGGIGTDTVVYNGTRDQFDVSLRNGQAIIKSLDNESLSDTLVNVEILQFDDGSEELIYSQNDQHVASLYEKILGRQPDLTGFQFWSRFAESELSLGEIALSLLRSEENTLQLGKGFEAHSTNEKVDLLYTELLGREADAEGKAFWYNALDIGLDPEMVVDAFLNAPEFAEQSTLPAFWDFGI